MKVARLAAIVGVAILVLSGPSLAQELSLTTTYNDNNSHDGNMFRVLAKTNLTIKRFDIHMEAGASTVEVYYKKGTWWGQEANPSVWTLLGVTPVTGLGAGTPTPLPLAIDISMLKDEAWSFYISTACDAPNLLYTTYIGSTPYQSGYEDDNLKVFHGNGLACNFGTSYKPRTWNGTVYYTAAGPLSGSVQQLSVGAGGSQVFSLDAGSANASLPYLVMGTASGSSPGFPLDGKILPLNIDSYTLYTISSPNTPPLSDSFGVLDASGNGSASFSLPPGAPSSLIGVTFSHAFATIKLEPTLLSLPLISNPVDCLIVP